MEDRFEDVWVQFADGFELYLPVNWPSYEYTDERIAQGIFFLADTEDMSHACPLGWTPLSAAYIVEALDAEIVAAEPETIMNKVPMAIADRYCLLSPYLTMIS